jgi:hypothetical protein
MILTSRRNFYTDGQRKALAGKVSGLISRAHELGMWAEDIVCQYTPDQLAVYVGVRSWRPEQLIEKIHQLEFRDFQSPAETGIRYDGERHWTMFRIGFEF